MPPVSPSIKPLDHLVLPTADIALARQRYEALGFKVAADARHPFGTENACVFLADKTYLEPLGIASREECEQSAMQGNMFTARDQAFRFRRGQEGFSAIIFGTADAEADHESFSGHGMSGGPLLAFSRPMTFPDGSVTTATFKLAFAADLRSPDFYAATCQRINVAPADRSALETHDNGVTGISEVVLAEPNPTDFQYFLQTVSGQREVNAHSFGMEIQTQNTRISVLNPDGMAAFFGLQKGCHARGMRGRAVVFSVRNLDQSQDFLHRRGIETRRAGSRLIVDTAPGQGAIFGFEEQK